jgi:GNAT superfamily N-acetyltransferase
MEVVHVADVSDAEGDELYDGEDDPYGGVGGGIRWRHKELHTVGRIGGRMVGHVGLTVALAEVERTPFAVVGVGGVLVARRERGRGRLRPVLEAALARAETLGPRFALLFCAARNEWLYERYGFRALADPVTVDQPDDGTAVMPTAAMWRPLAAGAAWPPGPVRLRSLPF